MKTTTTVELYKGCILTEEKNFIVDNLLSALASNYSNIRSSDSDGRLAFSNVQYQKIKLNMNLKLVGNETMLTQYGNYFYPSNNYNYALMIQTLYDDNDNIIKVGYYYFFVKKCKWLSQNCVELDIKLDTLNTYGYQLNNEVNAKSHTLRRHKDRWIKRSETDDSILMYPEIDFYSEGINALKYRDPDQDRVINDNSSGYNTSWYLLYQNNAELDSDADLSKAVQCFLYSDGQAVIPAVSSLGTLYLYDAAADGYNPPQPDSAYWKAIYFTYEDNGPSTFEFYHIDNNVRIVDGSITLDNKNSYIIIVYWESNGTLKLQVYDKFGGLYDEKTWTDTTRVDSQTLIAYRRFAGLRAQFQFIPHSMSTINGSNEVIYHPAGSGGRALFTTLPFSSVDRSNPALVKIIKMPYCPLDLSSINVRPNWETGGLEVIDITQAMNRTIRADILSYQHPFYKFANQTLAKSVLTSNTTPRAKTYESKLWHSDYYVVKLVYDSFSFDFRLEGQDGDIINSNTDFTKFVFDFSMTSTINSRFMFTFNFLTSAPVYATDYSNILIVIRNNETAIFNQQYINYLRAGYNYDVKSKTRTEAFTWTGVGLSIVGSAAAGAGAGAYAGGPYGAAAGAIIGAVIGGVSSILNAIKTTIDTEEAFNKKQEQLRQQATQVYGADDVDLLTKYTGNRAKLVYYNVSSKVSNLLFNLFYYFGYVSDEYGNPFANGWATSRKNFNFLQCELVFNTQWADSEIIEDLVDKFKVGATIFHKTTSGSDTNFYDFKQEKENWENSLED